MLKLKVFDIHFKNRVPGIVKTIVIFLCLQSMVSVPLAPQAYKVKYESDQMFCSINNFKFTLFPVGIAF